jgi:Tn3 transposase DDE domain
MAKSHLVVFHHVVNMTRVLQELIDEGYPVTPAIIARLSPYKREHINCFGHYDLRFDQVPNRLLKSCGFPLYAQCGKDKRPNGNCAQMVLSTHPHPRVVPQRHA